VGVIGTEHWNKLEPQFASVQVRRRMTDEEIARISPRALARGWLPPPELGPLVARLRTARPVR